MMRTPLLVLALLVLLMPGAWAQDWGQLRLDVRPGQGVGDLQLGQAVPDSTLKTLGKPSQSEAATDKPGSGLMLWGQGTSRDFKKGVLVRLGDGKDPNAIYSIELRGVRASTDKGLYLGAPASLVRKKYADAQLDHNAIERVNEYVVPGLTLRIERDKVTGMRVDSADATRWRFVTLDLVAGKSAGPIVLGKVIDPKVYELLGPPTFKQAPKQGPYSGLVRWSTGGQNPSHIIEVVLHNGKSPLAVASIRVKGVSAVTEQKVRLGDRADVVKEIYPSGRTGLHQLPGAETWRIPGLTLVLQDGKVIEMQLYPLQDTKPGRR